MTSVSSIDSSSRPSSIENRSPSNSIDSGYTTSSLDDESTAPCGFVPCLKDKQQKTIDIGSNGRTLSASPHGTILQLSAFHPIHGIIVASPHAQFDGKRFRDPEYVRWYRSLMLEDLQQSRPGFGIRLIGEPQNVNIGFRDNFAIQINFGVGDVSVEQLLTVHDDGRAVQILKISSPSDSVVRYVFGLHLCVNRASYGQLTEGGPLPIPESKNVLGLHENGRQVAVVNPNLGARLDANLMVDGVPVDLRSQLRCSKIEGAPYSGEYTAATSIQTGRPTTLTATFRLSPGVVESTLGAWIPSSPVQSRARWRVENDEAGVIIKRNLEYILGNCAVPVGNDSVCLLTDHVALPLGWNRDNYYQVRFLLDVYKHLHRLTNPETGQVYAKRIKKVSHGHLMWVYRTAQRPSGYWHRSYLANGVPKDGPVFQFDQQCYPLLEVCDFFSAFPEEKAFVKELVAEDTILEILDTLNAHRDKATGLYVTDETPGDDAVEYPFHFSSHILLWHTLIRLSRTLKDLGAPSKLNASALEEMASKIKDATFRHFVCEERFAYLTDGLGNHTFYHDANDLPTLFASDWGFVVTRREREIWANTMNYGLSPANKEGFFPQGPFGGLGSVHTRAPWPLGYAQEFIYAGMTGNLTGRESAWMRIKGAMFWDGLFAEAVDGQTGQCVSKAWFSWPGSVIGSALLNRELKEHLNGSKGEKRCCGASSQL